MFAKTCFCGCLLDTASLSVTNALILFLVDHKLQHVDLPPSKRNVCVIISDHVQSSYGLDYSNLRVCAVSRHVYTTEVEITTNISIVNNKFYVLASLTYEAPSHNIQSHYIRHVYEIMALHTHSFKPAFFVSRPIEGRRRKGLDYTQYHK